MMYIWKNNEGAEKAYKKTKVIFTESGEKGFLAARDRAPVLAFCGLSLMRACMKGM